MSGKALSSFTSGAGVAPTPWSPHVFRFAVMRLWGKRAESWSRCVGGPLGEGVVVVVAVVGAGRQERAENGAW